MGGHGHGGHGHGHHHGGGWGYGQVMPYPYAVWVDPLGADPVVTLQVTPAAVQEINSDDPLSVPWGDNLVTAMDPTSGVDTFAMDPANYLSGLGSHRKAVINPRTGQPVDVPHHQRRKHMRGMGEGIWVKNADDEYQYLTNEGMQGMGCGGTCACDSCQHDHGVSGLGATEISSKFTTPIIIAMAVMIGLCYLRKK